MTEAGLAAFVAGYGLALLWPLAVIEGPIVSVVAGVLCSQGLLAWYWVYPLLVLGDLCGDLLYYAAGRLSHSWLHRVGPRFGLPVARGEAMAGRVRDHDLRMLLIGKWTHAVGAFVLVAAGAARIGLSRFVVINLLATLPKSALLLGVGYYAGANFTDWLNHYGAFAFALPVLGIAAIVLVLRGTRGQTA